VITGQRVSHLQIEFKSLPLTRSTVSGGADPCTFSSVFLFEEFVPLESRQQLSVGVQNKRTLASFFSPGKSNWKQAAMLNGRPYVVGHVSRGLNSHEEEFEGLLRGNNSLMKMISLGRDVPVKREVTHSEGAHFGSSLSPARKYCSSVHATGPSWHTSATVLITDEPSAHPKLTNIWPDPFGGRNHRV